MKTSFHDKIEGMFLAFAVGDALGVGTEFMTKQEAAIRYPGGLKDYNQIIRDAHRMQIPQGDWTLDTEMFLMFAELILEKKGVDIPHMARELKKWWDENLPQDIGVAIRFVMRDPDYVNNPLDTCARIWTDSKSNFDANSEPLLRGLLAGVLPENHIDHAVDMTCLTHFNTRCSACSAVMANTAHTLLYEDRVPGYDETYALAKSYDESTLPYIETAFKKDISSLDLDDEDTMIYIRKCLAASLWCLWHDKTPAKTLEILLAEAGDADTTASNALGLTTLRYGKQTLPQQLVDGLVQKERLNDTATRYADFVTALS